MGKQSAPAAPDYTPIAQASQSQTQLAGQEFQQQMDYENQQMDLQKQALQWAQDQATQNQTQNQQVENANIDTQKAATAAAQNAQNQYETVFQPLEDKYVSQASGYDTPENEAFMSGQAQAQVAQSFDQQRQAAQQNLESFGVDPSSTRYAAMDVGLRTQQAAAQAAAGTQSILNTKQTGMGLESNAINIGMGLPANVNAGQNTAVNAGTSAANTGLATTASGANTMGTSAQYGSLAQGFAGAGTGALDAGTGAVNAWGNALNSGYSNQLSQFNANQNASSGLGGLAGTLIGGSSLSSGASGLGMLAALADGGTVPSAIPAGGPPAQSSALPTNGGRVASAMSPSNGMQSDDVPARLTADEFVVPRDVAKWKGEEFFQKMIQKSRQDRQTQAPAQPRAAGAIPGRPPVFQSRPSALPMR